MTASSSTMQAMESRRSAQRSDGLLECGRLSVTTSLCTRSSAAGPRCRLCPMRPHRWPLAKQHLRLPRRLQASLHLHLRPQTKEHVRLPQRHQALLQIPRRPQAKRHAHSGRAPAPMLPRRWPPMLGRCPLWPLATLSCSAPRRCATRACWECRRLETRGSCPNGTKCLKTAGSRSNGLVGEAIDIMPRRRSRQRSVGNMGSTRAGRSKRAVWRKRSLRSI